MDLEIYIEIKRGHAEQNAEDQRHLAKEGSMSYWNGKAQAFKEINEALKNGTVTENGIVTLELRKK